MKAVNLIPSEQRAAAKPAAAVAPGAPSEGSPLGAYIVLAVLAFAVAAAALYTLTTNSIKQDKAELAKVEQQASAVEAKATSLQSFADFQSLADARVATVQALAQSRFEWEQVLDDMSRALPEDVYISSFDGTTTGNASGSGLRGAILAPSIELLGCTDDQSSVARLMSRLRDIRGVTRVSLAKSEAIDTAETAAAPAPATTAPDGSEPSTISEPCPDGSPPSFDVIVFFERAAVTGAAAPNTSAVSAVGPTGQAGPTGAAGATTPASATTTTTTTTP